MHIHIQPLV